METCDVQKHFTDNELLVNDVQGAGGALGGGPSAMLVLLDHWYLKVGTFTHSDKRGTPLHLPYCTYIKNVSHPHLSWEGDSYQREAALGVLRNRPAFSC